MTPDIDEVAVVVGTAGGGGRGGARGAGLGAVVLGAGVSAAAAVCQCCMESLLAVGRRGIMGGSVKWGINEGRWEGKRNEI